MDCSTRSVVTTTSKCAERWLVFLVSLLMVVSSACEQEEGPRRFAPGGEYFKLLDASGKKHIVLGDQEQRLAKLRVRDQEIKVYDAQMRSIGTVEWIEKGEEGDEEIVITVEPRGEEPIELRRPGENVFQLDGFFRAERVERGWVVFDSDGQRLGYVEESEPGDYALRDDYSSPAKAYARKTESAVKSPSGRTIVTARPEFRSAALTGFAFEKELDVLGRVAFGLWLEKLKPE